MVLSTSLLFLPCLCESASLSVLTGLASEFLSPGICRQMHASLFLFYPLYFCVLYQLKTICFLKSCICIYKESACKAAEQGSISGSERSPGKGSGNPLQYSCLGNPMGRGAWQARVQKKPQRIRQDLTTKLSVSQYWCLETLGQLG